MPGVEAADFDCPGCGTTWTAISRLSPGGTGQVVVACEDCGEPMGTMRCDHGRPVLQPRPRDEANIGFLRVYGGDQRLMLTPRQ